MNKVVVLPTSQFDVVVLEENIIVTCDIIWPRVVYPAS